MFNILFTMEIASDHLWLAKAPATETLETMDTYILVVLQTLLSSSL